MKKILAFMTAIVLVGTSGVGVVSCIAEQTDGWPKLESGTYVQNGKDDVLYDRMELTFSIASIESDQPAGVIKNYTFREIPNNDFNSPIKLGLNDNDPLKITQLGEGAASADEAFYYLKFNREISVGYYLDLTFDKKTISTAVVPYHKKKDNGKIAGAVMFTGLTDKCEGRDIRIISYTYNMILDPSRFKLFGDFAKWGTTIIDMKFAMNEPDYVAIDAKLKNKPNKVYPDAQYLISYTNGDGVRSQGKVNQTGQECRPVKIA